MRSSGLSNIRKGGRVEQCRLDCTHLWFARGTRLPGHAHEPAWQAEQNVSLHSKDPDDDVCVSVISLHKRAALGLLLIATLWGASFIVVKEAIRSVDVTTFLAARFTIAALIFSFFLRRSQFNRSTLAKGAVVGFALAAGYWLQTTGLQSTTASKSAFLTSLAVIFVPAWEMLTSRRRPGRMLLLAAAIALAGTFLMVEAWREAIAPGDLLTIFCAIAFAAHLILATRYSQISDPTTLAFMQVATVALVTLPFANFASLPSLEWTTWLAIIGTGLVNTTLSFFILMWAQRHTSASEAVVLLSVEPVAALVMAAIFLSEVPPMVSLTGAFFILIAIFLAQRPAGKAG